MEEEEKFSDDPEENINIENEFLKIKLKAQFGDNFFMGGNGELPPEIENQFLKSLISFEENYKDAEFITIYEKMGKPNFVPAAQLKPHQFSKVLQNMHALLNENHLRLDICDGPYPDELIYTFITEELFDHEIEKEDMVGGTRIFIYEEFHPNDRAEIEKNTHQFLANWFSKNFNEYSSELAYQFVTAEGKQLNREELFLKINLFFDAFEVFENNGYNIDEIKFDLLPDGNGVGHAEGYLKYDARLENRESIHFEAPFKLYMQREGKYWSIFYFVMPGFKW